MLGFKLPVRFLEPDTLSTNVSLLPVTGPAIVLKRISDVLEDVVGAALLSSIILGAEDIPPIVPIIIGCCKSSSAKTIITEVPSTGPIGV